MTYKTLVGDQDVKPTLYGTIWVLRELQEALLYIAGLMYVNLYSCGNACILECFVFEMTSLENLPLQRGLLFTNWDGIGRRTKQGLSFFSLTLLRCFNQCFFFLCVRNSYCRICLTKEKKKTYVICLGGELQVVHY